MKQIIVIGAEQEYIGQIEKAAPGWDVISADPNIETTDLMQAEIITGWGKNIIDICNKSTNLRWMQSWSAGSDYYPLSDMKKKGIFLTSASGVHAIPISETVLAMMLSFTRGITKAISEKEKKQWTRIPILPELNGLTVGILGAGSIGLEVARLAKAFGMKTLGLNRSGASVSNLDEIYTMPQIDDLLKASDYIVNALPLTRETQGIINADRFAIMKKTVCYISIGRGPTTDQNALINALKEKTISYAGLDVTTPEPLPPDSPLWDMDNVIITPHNSSATPFYTERVMDIFLKNLKAYISTGKPIINLVDYDLMY